MSARRLWYHLTTATIASTPLSPICDRIESRAQVTFSNVLVERASTITRGRGTPRSTKICR